MKSGILKNRTLYVFGCVLIAMWLTMSCKQESGHMTETATQEQPSGDAATDQQRNGQEMTATRTEGGSNGASVAGSAEDRSAMAELNRSRKWWDNRTIYFKDQVGGTGPVVYEAIKGQPYLQGTKVFVYTTDVSMEGTTNYNKVSGTMEHTQMDDRIFIWVHLDNDRKVLFVKKLISDNIKDRLADATLRIE